MKDLGIPSPWVHPGCVLLSAGLSLWWLLAPGISLSSFLCRRKEQKRYKKLNQHFIFSSQRRNVLSHKTQPATSTWSSLETWLGTEGVWCMNPRGGVAWTRMTCVGADLVTITLTSNPSAAGHSLWSCLWHSNTIGRGRYLQEEKPRVPSGGGSLVETRLGLLELVIQLCLSAWRVLSSMRFGGKFGSASFGIVGLMTIWAALRGRCWSRHVSEGSQDHTQPLWVLPPRSCIPPCGGLKALGYFWGKSNFVLLLLVLPALPVPTASGAWVATALLRLPSNRSLL